MATGGPAALVQDAPGPVLPGPNGPAVVVRGSLSVFRGRLSTTLSKLAKAAYVAGALLTGLVVLGVPARDGPGALLSPLFASLLPWGLFLASFAVSLSDTASPATVEARREGLVVTHPNGAGTMYLRSEILGALLVRRAIPGGVAIPTVEMELRGGNRLTFRCRDEADARAVVDALGFGVGGARVVSRLAMPSRRLVHVGLAAVISVAVGLASTILVAASLPAGDAARSVFFASQALTPLVTLGLYELVKKRLFASEVVVGNDGVRAGRRIERFAPGARPRFPGMLLDRDRVAGVRRLAEERAAWAPATSPEAMARFDREGRSAAAWIAQVRGRLEQASYRVAASPAEDARAVLRSAVATQPQRVGAALALRVAGESRESIRNVADAAADERLRQALEAVADADDESSLERALDRFA